MALPTAPPAAAHARFVPGDAAGLGVRAPAASDDAAALWNGIVWGRLARGDLAWAWWRHLDLDGPLGAWARYEQALVLRELGLHEAAGELDAAGLEAATDLIDVVALRLSFAADAVGLGQPDVARSRYDAASDLLRELPESPRAARQRLRHAWVGVELALLDGAPPPTAGLPDVTTEGEVRQPADAVHGTDHHRAKGLLFGAVAHHRPELLSHAAAIAPPALRWAIELARADAGDTAAPGRAVDAWGDVVPPPTHAAAARATGTARRLAKLAATRDR